MKILKAFSLIEILIVISIISILATIAMPSYKNYLFKAKCLKILSLLNSYKLKVSEIYALTGQFPENSKQVFNGHTTLNLQKSSPEITTVGYELKNQTAVLFAKLKSAPLNGKNKIYLIGTSENEILSWHCDGKIFTDSIPDEFYPKTCKNNLG